MSETEASKPLPVWVDRLTPRASARVQLFVAAVVWAIGASILIFRGFQYVHDRSWHSWLLGGALALIIAIPKSRFILDKAALKGVARIQHRGRKCVFGFFSVAGYAFIGVMMGGGIWIRHTFVTPGEFGAGIRGAISLGLGTALVLADRIYWHAALQRGPQDGGMRMPRADDTGGNR
jgi:hypothetical protein